MSDSPGYLSLFEIPILRGRDIEESDTADAPGVVLINEAMARRYWPGENPAGQQIVIGEDLGPETKEPPRQIVGIVDNFHNAGLGRPPRRPCRSLELPIPSHSIAIRRSGTNIPTPLVMVTEPCTVAALSVVVRVAVPE